VQGVCKFYRSGRGQVAALSDVSLGVAAGSALAVVGRSGSGKTTLLNCIGGLERPDAGRVVCAGTEVHALGPSALARFLRQRVGFVFQFGNLLSFLTVRENLALPLELNGVFGRRRDRRVDALLETVGLPEVGAALPRELSGGETQRVAFARAIAHGPAILLADEPTASLDSHTGARLIGSMLDWVAGPGATLVVATHDPEVVARVTVAVRLKDGRREETA
jgi:putative ABC transport system ATP-binding protein